jgi:hypothetical protein
MKKYIFIFIYLVGFYQFNFSQSLAFQQIYPAQVDQSGKDVIEINSGYLIAGMNEKSPGDTDIYILKTDINGDTILSQSFGGGQPDYPYAIRSSGDGNFFIIGFTKSFGIGSYDIWLLKIDPQLNLLWSKTYGGTGDDVGKDIVSTYDGKFVVTGRSDSPGNLGYDAILLKIDVAGNLIWEHSYGGVLDENARALVECSDGGLAVIGQSFTNGAGSGDLFFFKTDSSGLLLWSKTYGGTLMDDGNDIVLNPDGTFILCGETNSFGNGGIDVWIIKTDASGNSIWDFTYGGTDKDVSKTIELTADGGYIIGAISRSWGWINPDMWLVKIDGSGLVQWTRHYGSWDHEHCYAVRQTSDGGFISIGHTKSYGPVSRIMFLKLDQNGTNELKDDFTSLPMFSVYPNPSRGKFILHFNESAFIDSIIEIEIYSFDGKIVYKEKCNILGNEIEIHLAENALKTGVYFCKVKNDKVLKQEKLIIE